MASSYTLSAEGAKRSARGCKGTRRGCSCTHCTRLATDLLQSAQSTTVSTGHNFSQYSTHQTAVRHLVGSRRTTVSTENEGQHRTQPQSAQDTPTVSTGTTTVSTGHNYSQYRTHQIAVWRLVGNRRTTVSTENYSQHRHNYSQYRTQLQSVQNTPDCGMAPGG